jgi:hypothetical protein
MKENNIQVWYGTWGVDVGLMNHVENEFMNSIPYPFILSTLIILLVIVLTWSNLY